MLYMDVRWRRVEGLESAWNILLEGWVDATELKQARGRRGKKETKGLVGSEEVLWIELEPKGRPNKRLDNAGGVLGWWMMVLEGRASDFNVKVWNKK